MAGTARQVVWQERESLESLDSWHEDDGHFGGDSGGGLRDPVDIDVDPFTITDVAVLQEMVHDATTELDALRNELDSSAEQDALMSMTTTTHLTKLVAENMNLRNELVSCKAAIAELEYQKEQLRLRLRRGDVVLPPGKAAAPPGTRRKAVATTLKWGIGRVFPPSPKAKKTLAQILTSPNPSSSPEAGPSVERASTTPPPPSHALELGQDRLLTRSSKNEPWGIDVDSTVDREGMWVHMVLAVQQGSAAEKAGICAGEVVLAVNHKSSLKLNHEDLVSNFQAPKSKLVVRMCECDDLVALLDRPMLTLL